MIDDYSHIDISVIYVIENIPGPMEESDEYKELLNNFNSQLTEHCNCDKSCVKSNCKCVTKYGSYTLYEQSVLRRDLESFSIVECNNLCYCSEDCGNRLVQKGPIPGLFAKVCNIRPKGNGLFTKYFIPRGSFICEYAGEVITKSQAIKRHKANALQNKMNYIFCLNEYCNNKVVQTIVDPSDIGNIGRYINHSCEPNCCIAPVRIETPIPKLAVFSCLDILPNKEITFDYGPLSIEHSYSDKNRKKCLCGAQKCRGLLPFDNY